MTVCSSFALIQVAERKSAALPGWVPVQQGQGPLGTSRPKKFLDDCLTNCRGKLPGSDLLTSCQKG